MRGVRPACGERDLKSEDEVFAGGPRNCEDSNAEFRMKNAGAGNHEQRAKQEPAPQTLATESNREAGLPTDAAGRAASDSRFSILNSVFGIRIFAIPWPIGRPSMRASRLRSL